ncbi:MAG: PorT family protein [Hymenobacter sp.]|nr:MAG: PorT family protein [Hymenobacter sp.]
MKYLVFVLAGGSLLASEAHAQLGVRAGANLAYLHENFSRNAFATSTIARVGYQVGVYYELPLGKHWALVPEVQFSRESQQLRKEGVGYSTYFINDGSFLIHDYQASFSYLNVPVLLRRSIGPAYLEVGPQVSLLVGGQGSGETRHVADSPYYNGFYVTYEPINQAATAYYNRWDAGVCLGAGVRLPAGWGAGVRAYWGASSLTGDPKDYQYAPNVMPVAGRQYRRTVQASLTYRLRSGKAAAI